MRYLGGNAHAKDGRYTHVVAHMDPRSSRSREQDQSEDVHEADMELDADLEVKDTDVVSSGEYDNDDAFQDEPEENFEHHAGTRLGRG